MPLVINGEEIDEDLIDAEFRQIKGHYERTLQVACCERDPEFRGYAKDNIISRTLLKMEADKRFPEVAESEVTQRLQKLIDEAGGETKFYLNLGLPGKNEEAVKPNVANGLRLDKMLEQIYQPEPTFSEDETLAWYQAHLDFFLTDEEIHVVHITKNLQGAESREKVFTELRALRQQALNGADFTTLAESQRLDETQQIDLGWFKRGEFMEEFEVIAFSMNEGEISPVFATQLGLHLCTVLGRRSPEPKPFADVREEVRLRMLDNFRDERFNEFLAQLKTEATIEDSEPEASWGAQH